MTLIQIKKPNNAFLLLIFFYFFFLFQHLIRQTRIHILMIFVRHYVKSAVNAALTRETSPEFMRQYPITSGFIHMSQVFSFFAAAGITLANYDRVYDGLKIEPMLHPKMSGPLVDRTLKCGFAVGMFSVTLPVCYFASILSPIVVPIAYIANPNPQKQMNK